MPLKVSPEVKKYVHDLKAAYGAKLDQLKAENRELAAQINDLEYQLTVVRNDAPKPLPEVHKVRLWNSFEAGVGLGFGFFAAGLVIAAVPFIVLFGGVLGYSM